MHVCVYMCVYYVFRLSPGLLMRIGWNVPQVLLPCHAGWFCNRLLQNYSIIRQKNIFYVIGKYIVSNFTHLIPCDCTNIFQFSSIGWSDLWFLIDILLKPTVYHSCFHCLIMQCPFHALPFFGREGNERNWRKYWFKKCIKIRICEEHQCHMAQFKVQG